MSKLMNEEILQEVQNSKTGLHESVTRSLLALESEVNVELSENKKDYKIDRVEFLFNHIESSSDKYAYIQFTLKNDLCKDWFFGYEIRLKSVDKYFVIFDYYLWAQHEKTYDKFRFSDAQYKVNKKLYVHIDYDNYKQRYVDFPFDFTDIKAITKIFNYINTYKEKAFCRDFYGWDYNVEEHTNKSCVNKYNKWLTVYTKEKNAEEACRVLTLKWLKNTLIPFFDDDSAIILDNGSNCSPRYNIVLKARNETEENNYYACFLTHGEYADAEKSYKELVKECKKIYREKRLHFYEWHVMPVTIYDLTSAEIYSEKRYNKVKEKPFVDNDITVYDNRIL